MWGNSFSNEIGRLAQGIPGRFEGTDTVNFVKYDEILADRTYKIIKKHIKTKI